MPISGQERAHGAARLRAAALAGAAFFVTAAPLAAQTAPPPPALQRTVPTREEIERAEPRETAPRSRLTVEGGIERSPCALADPAYAGIMVRIDTVEFGNLGPVAPALLAPAWAPYAGTEQPVGVICEIRDAAATILRREGYLAAVQVPTQRIENGQVRFEVLYARLTALRVRGDAGGAERLLEAYLGRLTEQPVFNRRAAERHLLLARDLPGLDVRMALKPAGTGPGEMIGEVTVKRTPYELGLVVQNLAAPDTGRWGGQLVAQFYGLTGLGDRTTVSAYSTPDFDEQQVVQLGHEFRVGGNGLRLAGNFTYAWTRPDLGPDAPEVLAKTLFANVEASYPLVRRQAFGASAAAGLDYVDQRVRFGVLPLSRDRVRVGYARLDLYGVDLAGIGPGGTTGWRLNGALELRRGLAILDASRGCLANLAACAAQGAVPPSLFDGDPTATVFRVNATAELRPLADWTVAIGVRAQSADAALFAFEQFAAGNYTIGRGYEPGALTGDEGAAFSVELRPDPFRLRPQSRLFLQPFGFADNAWVWDRNRLGDPARLSSLGGGLRVTWDNRARLDMTLAAPTRRVRGERDVRFLISLSTRLLPWGTR